MKSARHKWIRRFVMAVVVMTVAALVGGELVARYGLGLGDPPLSVVDETIEYRFKPGEYHRFGNRVFYNAYSMRSDEVSRVRADPQELRVLMLGDSVINGGVLTDQHDLASEILRRRLMEATGRPTWVGNVSAGSWGPANLLAYVQKYGWFEADVAVVVLSSHDAADVPTFEPTVGVHPAYPDRAPLLALQEAIARYLPRYLLSRFAAEEPPDPGVEARPPLAADDPDVQASLDALRRLVASAREHGVRLLIVLHVTRTELDHGVEAGHTLIRRVADDEQVPVLDNADAMRAALGRGDIPYRGNIHLNAVGQQILADLIGPMIETSP